MNIESIDSISKKWREEGLQYTKDINEFVHKGMTLGWKEAGTQPKDPRSELAKQVIQYVRDFNKTGNIEELRKKFPPAHAPFFGMLEENGCTISPIMLLENNKIILRVGAPYEEGKIFQIDGPKISTIEGLISFGRSPDRRYFAIAKTSGVEIHDGWEGPLTAELSWPTGLEDLPGDISMDPISGVPNITQLIPFPDGKRVLLVSSSGVFVLTSDGSRMLYPGQKEIREHVAWHQKEDPENQKKRMYIDMEHGAVSVDGKYIATGSQDSNHLVFNSKYELTGNIGASSEYPHYAVFSEDNEMLACNSCHMYYGATLGIPVSLLSNIETKPYAPDDRFVLLEGDSRVYAAVFQNDRLIIGNANGYLRAVDKKGNLLWQHFIGSSIGDIDISSDNKTLIASTYAGFLCLINLDTGELDPYTIGNSTHKEIRRWLFWKNEEKPLVW